MSDIDKPLPVDAPNVTLTIRMIMNGKEVGSIIGKGGEIINSIREDSGAKIHITDGSVPERIVTVTGQTDNILKAFSMICGKFESDDNNGGGGSTTPRPPVTLRLIVPASQCGSLIGKGGSKIKEIREVTGASIQVASEMLPASTERAVTVSGTKDAIAQCIYHVCVVMLESPPKGTPVPYTPKSGAAGLLAAAVSSGSRGGGSNRMFAGTSPVQDNPLASLLGLGGGGAGGASTLAALASIAGSQISRDNRGGSHHRDHERSSSNSGTQTYEMSIPNELIGCIIGKGGSKIAEIRQISGAMIRISKSGDHAESVGGEGGSEKNNERQITITGNSDSIALAKSLINMSLDLHKSKLEDREQQQRERGGEHHGSSSRPSSSRFGSSSGSGSDLSLAAQLLAKPEALTTALTTLATFGGLGSLGGLGQVAAAGLLGGLGGGGGNMSGPGQVTGVHRSRGAGGGGGYGGGSSGGSGSSRSSRDEDGGGRGGRDSKRSKFAPY